VGRVAAMTFAKHGATVVLHGRSTAKLEVIYDEIEAAGYPQPAILVLEFLKAGEADYQGLAETIFASFKQLDGIFHAAGHMEPLCSIALQNMNTWHAHFTINVLAPVAITRVCLPMLKRAPFNNGNVVFLSETHAIEPKAYWGAFATTKASLSHIAIIWNDEVAHESQLRMRVLLPGPIASQMRAMSHPGELPSQSPPVASLIPSMLYLISGAAADEVVIGDAPVIYQP
ncbi:MAG: SDR family NAD(P)-dependent oxidoreductase, partial [Pseudomonadota bacterium]